MKQLLILLLSAVLLVSCGTEKTGTEDTTPETQPAAEKTEAETEESEVTKTIGITALGDSITRGYGLADVSGDRFTTVLHDLLKKDGVTAKVANYGVDGITSGGLLDELEAGYYTAVKAADTVTLCIGANNILGAGFDFFEAYAADPEGDLTDDYALMRKRADAGIADLEEDLPKILENIRELNPDCRIVLLNLYNPYAHIDISLDAIEEGMTIASLTDEYIRKMHAVTQSYLEDDMGFVDVYAAFEGHSAAYVCAYSEDGKLTNVDPHPTADGHEAIGEALYNAEFIMQKEE